MNFSKWDTLLSLRTEQTWYKVCVRAMAIWKGVNRKTNEFRGFNIIFIDEQNCRIHAFISEKISDAYVEDLKEGQVYSLSNFKVSTYQGDETNRAVRNEKHIFFDSETILEVVKQDIPKIMDYAFDLFRLADVHECFIENRFLIDVIGVVDTKGLRVVHSKEAQNKSHLKFMITDGRYKVNVTFWDEFGESFDKAFKEIGEEEVVVILSSAKPNKYDGELYLSNYPATRFYINPKHYSVPVLLNSLKVLGCEDEKDHELFTIDHIKKLKEQHIEIPIVTKVTVKKVEEQYNWFDNYCTSCEEEVNIVDGRFRCAKCQRNIPFPDKRFRLCTVCSDNTGIIAIIFPDDEIQRIIGKNAFELENDVTQVGLDIPFPPLLKDFEKKEYIVTLKPSAENIKKGSRFYKALKLIQLEGIGEKLSSPIHISSDMDDISMNTEIGGSTLPKQYSPPTEKSTNRSRARKNKVVVKCEMDENVPMAKLMKS